MGSIVVVAEDEEDLRVVYGTALREAGYHVWEVADGAQALQAIREHRPDLLLLDIWMPILDGFEVLEAMRHDPISAGVKVVMLSCADDADCRLEAFSAGVADYWVKGLSLDELRQRVGRILEEAPGEPEAG
jgi:DNA-binding response OmpR family regulator